ncbi:hypothetical protein KFK09_011547 [Dendrobium nobile]|uniref:Uncharacterized protein n=1 Tax=Dendrobium nobile TaxID=94219 RepID=A0A8T3BD71_DENNO|nr:hypothetical protein KFK09_011547 [Dendrobium nobile]
MSDMSVVYSHLGIDLIECSSHLNRKVCHLCALRACPPKVLCSRTDVHLKGPNCHLILIWSPICRLFIVAISYSNPSSLVVHLSSCSLYILFKFKLSEFGSSLEAPYIAIQVSYYLLEFKFWSSIVHLSSNPLLFKSCSSHMFTKIFSSLPASPPCRKNFEKLGHHTTLLKALW